MADLSDLGIGKIVGGVSGILAIFFVLIILFGAFYYVDPGHVGVKFYKTGGRGFEPAELKQGFGLKVPFVEHVYEMPFQTQTIGFYGQTEERGTYGAITPMDNNGITFQVDVTVRYRLDPTQASEFIEQKGTGVASMETILATAARADSTRGVFGRYAQEDVPGKRLDLASEVQQVLQKRIDQEASGKLKPGFIVVEAVDIRDVQFNQQIADRIIEKQKKLQEAQQKVYELETANRTREIELVNADRDKQAAILRAQGEGESILIVATAKAEGIKKVNEAYQNMPQSYVATQFATAIQPTDKLILGLDSIGGSGVLPIMDVNKLMAARMANMTG